MKTVNDNEVYAARIMNLPGVVPVFCTAEHAEYWCGWFPRYRKGKLSLTGELLDVLTTCFHCAWCGVLVAWPDRCALHGSVPMENEYLCPEYVHVGVGPACAVTYQLRCSGQRVTDDDVEALRIIAMTEPDPGPTAPKEWMQFVFDMRGQG